MSDLLIYKCPCCDGAIEFDSTSQKLKCPFCDTEFDVNTIEEYNNEINSNNTDDLNWTNFSTDDWIDDDSDNIIEYSCNACGGVIIANSNTAATSCPFCDNTVIIQNKLRNSLKPDFIIPFKLDKKAAKESLLNHFKGKKLLPKVFKDENHIDDIKGMYVPFWLFNCDSQGNARYRATRVRTWRDSNYIYTETSYYLVKRSGKMNFEKVPVDGSSIIDDKLMESIEPYNWNEIMDFNTAYLSGYFADKYDVDSEATSQRANDRIKKSTSSALDSTVIGYNSVIQQNLNISLTNTSVKYALLPVWFLNTTWNGQKFIFVMNGQTGKFAGNLPLDKKAYRNWLWGLTAIIGLIATIISMFFI